MRKQTLLLLSKLFIVSSPTLMTVRSLLQRRKLETGVRKIRLILNFLFVNVSLKLILCRVLRRVPLC